MNELAKTLTFLGAAVAVLVIALLLRPRPELGEFNVADREILNEVEDPLSSKRLEIVRFNESTSDLSQFEVAEVDGVWSIPSHQNYPADAEEQMGQAAASVMNLNVLGVASTSPADQVTYGVVDPDPAKLSAGAVGVGVRVRMEDAQGEPLVNLIIGKEVKDEPDQRYVRIANEDPIYIVELDPSKLTTKFEDWIEEDLLQLNAFDIRRVTLKDYSAEIAATLRGELTVVPDPRSIIDVAYDDDESKWNINSIKTFDQEAGEYQEVALGENEEPNSTKLNALKTALDDLKIVNVERKPEGLSQNLQADTDFANNQAALESLFRRGFFLVGGGADGYEIYSREGEVLCQMSDGVEYVLRFGEIAGVDAESEAEAPMPGTAADGDEPQGTGLNRYLFVTARFNEDAIEKPQMEDLPEMPGSQSGARDSQPAGEPPTPQSGQEPSDSAGSAETPGETQPAPTDPAEANSPADQPGTDTPGETDGAAATSRIPVHLASYRQDAEQPPSDTATTDAAAEVQADAAQDNALDSPAEETPADDPAAANAPAEPATQATAAGDSQSEMERAIAERKAIEQENQRKLDEYQEKITQGRERVTKLNERFGDWYYVISDEVYRKIHLTKDDVIQPKQPADAQQNSTATPTSPLDQLNSLDSIPGLNAPQN
ncbi:MAG: DUF4340 domain-containing protein [Pirellulales bacterium]